ncbi:UDP-glucose 4-epimerase [Murinocardiopsis flavida]|uniref:UDP-glucose 4-epimerase n=1 Tax=Murinocardiopsis flavida TaxID=645275 RepID=A0A2P8DQW1_9ACTN|nr:NAD-dependent epimerase/dehydratase family protein [Murinocardiopsis flavida]PSK99607.1 UDP-glucose 4-epimerase [Murinocardiopsis flavida]
MGRVVLVTGVSRYLGARVATALHADPGVDRVIGVDSAPPRRPLGRLEFVRAELHDSSLDAVVRDSGADTVLHLSLAASPAGAGGRAAMKENNVLGTMQLLAACQRSATVRRLVVRSTAAVYGSSSRDPALHTEESEAREAPRSGYAKDAVEVERHTSGLARRRPDLSVAVLRFASFMGPVVDTPLTRYFGLKIVPTVLGYDPRMQFIHEDDGVEVIRRMALGDAEGVFNVAAPGAMPLSQCLRRAGRPEMPVPARGLRMLGGLARRAVLDYSPEQLRLLCYGRVLDSAKLQDALGWRPRHSSEEAFDSFVAERGFPAKAPARMVGRVTHRFRAAASR